MTKTKLQLRKEIISAVLRDHRIDADELVAKCRSPILVAARKDAAQRLHRAGFNTSHIGRILKHDRSTIRHHISDLVASRDRDRRRARLAVKRLKRGVADILAEIAAAEGVSTSVLAAEWLAERATFEAEAKARAT